MHLRLQKILLLLCCLAFGAQQSRAQARQLPVEVFSLEQGLSHWVILTIIQDHDGYLWIGTGGGLNRYDGERFQTFIHDPEDSSSLSNNYVSALHESSHNDERILWVGSEGGGLSRLAVDSLGRQTFFHYKSDPAIEQSLCDDFVTSLASTEAGLWIGTTNGLCLLPWQEIHTGRFTSFFHNPADSLSLAGDEVNALFTDSDGGLWIGTEDGLSRLEYGDDGNMFFTSFKPDSKNPTSLSGRSVTAIHETKSGSDRWLWLGVGQRLARLNLVQWESGVFEHYRHAPAARFRRAGASIQTITSTNVDGRQALWVGATKGLSKLVLDSTEPASFENYYSEFGGNRGLSDDYIHAAFVDHAGVLWIGTDDGLNKYNPYKNRFTSFSREVGGSDDNVVDALITTQEGDEEIVWVGAWGGGLTQLRRMQNNGPAFQSLSFGKTLQNQAHFRYIRAFGYSEFAAEKHLWIGTDGEGLFQVKINSPDKGRLTHFRHDDVNPNSLVNNQIRVIHIAPEQKRIWIGTAVGLSRIDFDDDGQVNFKNYNESSLSNIGFVNDEIKALHQTNMFGQWMLWIGTDGGGLARLFVDDIGEEVFQTYRHEPGNHKSLKNNVVRTILIRENANQRKEVWLGTDQGLARLAQDDIENGIFTHYSTDDGLPSNQIVGLQGDDRGRIWISTNRGVSRFDPGSDSRKFRNYGVVDGLQSWEFNQGAHHTSARGEIYFGGEKGFNVFHPDSIRDNPHPPRLVLTEFRILDQPVTPGDENSPLQKPISETERIELTHEQNVFSFNFRGLHFSDSEKIKYRYFLLGYDRDWQVTDSAQPTARYSNVSAGDYIFFVSAANSDGVWNENPIQVDIKISPPYWQTWPFLSLFAFVVAMAGYSIYRLILSSKLEKARIRSELNTARNIQLGLMPQSPPKIAELDVAGICKPAEEVGGDYFDYIWLDERRTKIGVAVADVSGKAMAGAMTAVMTSGMIYGEAGGNSAPKSILRKINRPLFHKTDRRIFTAMLFAAFDTQAKTLVLANAGQTPPLFLRNGSFEYITVNGVRFPLGLQKNAAYEETEIKLQSGDVLIFYTDGVPETMNARQEEFDYEGMERTVRQKITPAMNANDILETFIQEVQLFSKSSQQHDDLTMVVVKVA